MINDGGVSSSCRDVGLAFYPARLMKEYRKILYNFIRSGKILSPPGACGEKMPVVKYKKRKPVCDAGISGQRVS